MGKRDSIEIKKIIQESIKVKNELLDDEALISMVDEIVDVIIKCFSRGNKIVLCGNGGSASDAIHFAGEMIGRFQMERLALPVISLNTDIATMTAISNDYGYENVFARQADALIQKGDIFIGISTSGNSKNVYNAAILSGKKGATTIALLGCKGGIMKDIVDYPIVIPSEITARIQECHILLIHIICELVEKRLYA